MVTIGYGTKQFPDSYVHFKRMEDVKEYIQHDIRFSDRFKARDFVDFQTSDQDLNGVSHNERQNLTIETPAKFDFKNNDYIFDVKYQIPWKVVNVQTVDDSQNKENSMRPRKLTRLQLIR